MKNRILEILSKDISDSEKADLIEELYKDSSLAPIEERREAFRKKVWSWYFKNGKELYHKQEIESFVTVWSALSSDLKNMKFEKEKKFQIANRLKQFKTKQEDFSEQKRIEEFKKRLGSFNPMR